MSFFFSKQKNRHNKARNISATTLHELQCKVCPLNNRPMVCNGNMPASGSVKPILYFLGDAPSRVDDVEGEPFVGPAGLYLKAQLTGKMIDDACRFNNVVRTITVGDDIPQYMEIECCRPSVVADIEKTKPPVIVGMGQVALKWASGASGINIWRGRHIPVKIGNHSCWFIPTYHPAYLLRQRLSLVGNDPKDTPEEALFKQDISKAIQGQFLLTPPVVEDVDHLHDGIQIFMGDDPAQEFAAIEKGLIKLADQPRVGLDIETHSEEKGTSRKIRPYGKGTRILSCAIGKYQGVYSFLLDHPKSGFSPLFKDKLDDLLHEFLTEAPTYKIAHNLGFELEWLSYFYGDEIIESNWHDSMAQAYVLDGRKGALSLDALIMQRRGFNLKAVYNLDMDVLIKQPLDVLLKYNALDTRFEDLLFSQQLVDLENQGLTHVYEEQVRRTKTLTKTQIKGVQTSDARSAEHQDRLATGIQNVLARIEALPVVQKYISQAGAFNPMSNKQLGELLKDYLRCGEGYRGKTKQYAVHEEVLESIKSKHVIAAYVLELRKLNKAKSTYVDGFRHDAKKYVWPDSRVHPVFKSMFVITRRLSCEDPNVQNFTKRTNRELRQQIVAPLAHRLVACDYGQIEARVIGMASGDAQLISALWDRYDIHQEWAERIVLAMPSLGDKNDKDFMKDLRDRTKNKFVFPSFYGAQPHSISQSYGLDMHTTKTLQEEFWKMFPGVQEWQARLNKQYEECGFVELLTGFRCYGPLKYNEVINYPIQGTASDIVLDAMNRLSEQATVEQRPALQAVLNVHDDLTFYIPDATFDDDIDTIVGAMLKPEFDFINVPISVEVEMGNDWYKVDPIGTFWSDKW